MSPAPCQWVVPGVAQAKFPILKHFGALSFPQTQQEPCRTFKIWPSLVGMPVGSHTSGQRHIRAGNVCILKSRIDVNIFGQFGGAFECDGAVASLGGARDDRYLHYLLTWNFLVFVRDFIREVGHFIGTIERRDSAVQRLHSAFS